MTVLGKVVSTGASMPSYLAGNVRFVWYRIHVQVNPDLRYLALEIQAIQGSCEIFSNGVPIGVIDDILL